MGLDVVPRVRLLGRPAVCGRDGGWTEFPSGLRAAALGYLAFQGRWVARDELLALFWPDRPEGTARGNLRPLLAKLARDQRVWGLERERSRVRWRAESDVGDLLRAHGERRWSDVWRLAGGGLLEGVTVLRAPEFESWLAIERERVREVVRTAGVNVADAALEAGELHEAGEVLAVLQRLDPLDEAVVRRLMVACARRGARGDALTVFEGFVERCREELGAEPEVETSELAEAVRSGREGTVAERLPKPLESAAAEVPVPLTPMVGRGREVGEVIARLGEPGCRLVTLVGPGGIGKTRLALEVGRLAAPRFADGVRVVDLAAVSGDGGALAAVAEAVGVDPAGVDAAALFTALAGRDCLLVLDNVEQLEAVPGLVRDLLHRAPRVQVLATSRSVLGLAAEWRHDVMGLAYRPESAADAVGSPSNTPGAARDTGAALSEAAEHFVAASRRASARFESRKGDAEVVERIAARLAGSPLALEFAAGWTRVLDVRAIDEVLGRGSELLAADAADRPERHASMRRVLDQSWAMLQPRERVAMRRLAVFRGGFDRAAAQEVAEVGLPTLLALVNKSFVWRVAGERFSWHPLVWRDARERALEHEAEYQTTCSRHARHYLRLLAEGRDAYRRADGGARIRAIEDDFANVAAAWRTAIAARDHDLLLPGVLSLLQLRHARGRHGVIDDLFSEALAAAPDDGALRGMLLAVIGGAETWAGRGDHGVGKLRDAGRMLEGRADPLDRAWLSFALGMALGRQGRREEAVAALQQSVDRYRALGDVASEITALRSLASQATNRVGEALRRRRELEARARATGTTQVLWALMGGIATHERLLGEFARAERAARSLRAYADDAEGVSFKAIRSRNALAAAYFESGRLRRAQALACGTLRRPELAYAREQFGDVVVGAAALLGRVALVWGDSAAAASWSQRALEQLRAMHGPEAAFDFVLETLARVSLANGDAATASVWLDSVGRGPDPWWFEGPLMREARRAGCRCCLAEAALLRGETSAARQELCDLLDSTVAAELVTATLGAFVSAARCFRVIADEQRAGRLLRYVRDHPRATFEARMAAAWAGDSGVGGLADGVDDGVEGVHGVAADVMAILAADTG